MDNMLLYYRQGVAVQVTGGADEKNHTVKQERKRTCTDKERIVFVTQRSQAAKMKPTQLLIGNQLFTIDISD